MLLSFHSLQGGDCGGLGFSSCAHICRLRGNRLFVGHRNIFLLCSSCMTNVLNPRTLQELMYMSNERSMSLTSAQRQQQKTSIIAYPDATNHISHSLAENTSRDSAAALEGLSRSRFLGSKCSRCSCCHNLWVGKSWQITWHYYYYCRIRFEILAKGVDILNFEFRL